MNRLWCHGARARNDQLWASADQRSRSHETEDRLKAWWRHHYQPWGRAVFCLFLVNCWQNLAYTYEMYKFTVLFIQNKTRGQTRKPYSTEGVENAASTRPPGVMWLWSLISWSPKPIVSPANLQHSRFIWCQKSRSQLWKCMNGRMDEWPRRKQYASCQSGTASSFPACNSTIAQHHTSTSSSRGIKQLGITKNFKHLFLPWLGPNGPMSCLRKCIISFVSSSITVQHTTLHSLPVS